MGKKSARGSFVLMVLVTLAGAIGIVCGTSRSVAQAQSDRLSSVRNPNQVPTARYGRGEAVDLSLIVEEWRDRYPTIPVFVCTCNADSCGDKTVWPFRTYTRYQPLVALGNFNAASSEANRFNCFDMETGERPE